MVGMALLARPGHRAISLQIYKGIDSAQSDAKLQYSKSRALDIGKAILRTLVNLISNWYANFPSTN